MARTKQTRTNATPGFAIKIEDDTELGMAILIVEDEEGTTYLPIGVVASINEARQVAAADMRSRLRRLERDEDPGICPYIYKVWAQGIGGDYRQAKKIAI